MKRIFVLTALVLMFGVRMAHAQVKIGVKAGVNLNELSFGQELFSTTNRLGFFAGPTVRASIPALYGFSADLSALFDQRSAQLQMREGIPEEWSKKNIYQRQISFPLNLRYGLDLGKSTNVFLFAGPQLSFVVGDKEQTLIRDIAEWRLNDSNLSANLGVGMTFFTNFQLTLNYNTSVGKTGEVNIGEAFGDLKDLHKTYKGRAHAWQISAAYFF